MFCPSFTWQADLHGEFVPLRQTRRLAAWIACRSLDRIDRFLLSVSPKLIVLAIGAPCHRSFRRFNYKNKSTKGEKTAKKLFAVSLGKNGPFRRAQTSKLELLRSSRENIPVLAPIPIHRSYEGNESFFEQRPTSKLDRRGAQVGKACGTNRFRADPWRSLIMDDIYNAVMSTDWR